jgi:hypothetical protein
MNSINSIIDMILTEAIEGISREHYFDEYRNREFIRETKYEQHKDKTKLPPIKYKLELIQKGEIFYWAED